MAKKKANKDIMGIGVPIEWYIPDGIITPFATNMLVQIVEDVFKLSFFEKKVPITFDPSAPPPSKVRADCVASVIVTPDKLEKIIEVLQSQLDNYKLKKSA